MQCFCKFTPQMLALIIKPHIPGVGVSPGPRILLAIHTGCYTQQNLLHEDSSLLWGYYYYYYYYILKSGSDQHDDLSDSCCVVETYLRHC